MKFNYFINLLLKWPTNCFSVVATAANQIPTFRITDNKLYVPVVTLSIQYNVKLLKQFESGFKKTINWNKQQSKTTNYRKNWYLEFLIDPSFQGVNNLFVFSFEDENGQESYYLPTAEVKYYNFMINGRSFLD